MTTEDRQTFELDLAGQQWDVQVATDELETVHERLLSRCFSAAADTDGRYIVFIAGPPGAGKTALAALWELLARQRGTETPVQALPMDGFHYPNAGLDTTSVEIDGESVLLRKIKGDPETFDIAGMAASLRKVHLGEPLCWPRYDRQIHAPVPDALEVVSRGVVLVEGNYLLLDEPGWRELSAFADLRIFIECDEALVREDVVRRGERGGRSRESALEHFETNDSRNFRRVMLHRLAPDVILRVGPGRGLKIISEY